MVIEWLPHLQIANLYMTLYNCRSRGSVMRARGKNTPSPFIQKQKSFPEVRPPSVWAEGGLMASEMQGSWDKGAPSFYSNYFGRWARRRRENQQPKRLSQLTGSVSFFPFYSVHRNHCLPTLPKGLEMDSDKLTIVTVDSSV